MSPGPALLLERERELGEIVDLLERARAGSGGALLVEGPGGIGKTGLLLAAESAARERGMAVAAARGAELEREYAFGVVRQLFDRTVSGAGGTELLTGAAELAAPVFDPAQADRAAPGVAERSFAVLHGLHWLCATLAERAPLLLVVDDAHWSDPASLGFLAYLARRVDELPLAVLVASRPAEEAAEDHLLHELHGDPRTPVVRPAPLGPAAVAELLRGDAGEPEPAFVEVCRQATEGNPFLLSELVHEVREQRISPSEGQAERVRELGPRTVARRLLARLGRASPLALPVARAVAVLGVDAQARHIAGLAGIPASEAAEALDALEAAGLVSGARPVEFAHPIVRSAIYADIPAGERSRLHSLAARLLADEDAAGERIAGQLLATEPAADRATVEQLGAAARQALGRGAPSSAAAYLRRSLAEPPPRDLRGGVLAELGAAESLVGDARAVTHLREALARSPDADTRRAAALALGRFLVLSGQPGSAAGIFNTAARGSGRWALALEAAAVAAGVGDAEAAPQMQERLESLRAWAGMDPETPSGVFAALAIADAQANAPAAEVAALARRALAGGSRRGLGWTTGLVAVFSALLFAERYDEADSAVEDGLGIARARGSAIHFAMCSAMRACLRLRRGAIVDAEEDARAALDAAPRQAHGFYGMFALATLVESLLERDRPAEAERELERIGVPARATAATYGAVLHARGKLQLEQRRPAEALEDFLAAGRHLTRALCLSPSAAPWRSSAALAAVAVGQPEAARVHAAEEIALARRAGTPRALGIALRAAGLVEGGSGGLALLDESARTLEGSQAALEHARSLADLGAALRRGGRRADAREPLRRALDLAHRHRGEAVATLARAELLATGARPRKMVVSGPDSLTASERRVAQLAAGGMSNRDIAQALFVSLRTVETHLTHAFRKLDIDSRTELAESLGDVRS